MREQLLTFLGKDSGFGKQNNSAYIDLGDRLIIIDCGFTVFQQIKDKFKLEKYKEIDIIITHLHNDHAGSLSQLILYMWFIHNKKVTIYSCCENIKTYLDITGAPLDAYELKSGNENLEFIRTEHTEQIDSYGFILKLKGKTILYTGDTNTILPFLPYVKSINELYIDVSRYGGVHLKIDEIVKELKDIQSKGVNIVFMHIDDCEYVEKIGKDADLFFEIANE